MKVDAILCADLHIREDVPICRIDDFISAQIKKLNKIKELALEHKCPVLIAGDVFNNARSSPFVLSLAFDTLFNSQIKIITIPGQHDLPSHSLKNYERSSLNVLEKAKTIINLNTNGFVRDNNNNTSIFGFPFGTEIKCDLKDDSFKIALVHKMIHNEEKIHESIESIPAISLLKNNNFDLIVSGDNHQPFIVKYKNKLLVNCGSLMRIRSNQADYKPAVWLWNKEKNEVTPEYFFIRKEIVIRDHIEAKSKKDQKMETFVKSIRGNYEVSFSFKDNMEKYFDNKKIRNGIKEEIYSAYP